MKLKPKIFDIEIYPNHFMITFKTLNEQEIDVFNVFYDTIGEKHLNDLNEMFVFINLCGTLISYNGTEYDYLVLNYLIKNKEDFLEYPTETIVKKLKTFNDIVINSQSFGNFKKEPKLISELRRCNFYRRFDVLLLFNTAQRTSLKNLAVSIKWPMIMDLPFSPNTIIKHHHILHIAKYNLNDVLILEAIVNLLKDIIQERIEMSPVFGLDLKQENDTNVAKKIFGKYYNEFTGENIKKFKNKGTFYDEILLKDCVSPKIKFVTKNYNNLLNKILEKKTNPNQTDDDEENQKKPKFIYKDGYWEAINKEFEFNVKSKYLKHTIAKGGIHSINESEVIEEGEDYYLYDIDVNSYYPFIFIVLELFPKHIGPIYLKILRTIVYERIRAKKEKEKKAGILKISANSSYGLTKPKTSEYYDPKVTLSTCVNGELFLLMLIEKLEFISNCIVIYSNTDGLTIKVPKQEFSIFMKICKDWEDYTGFTLEYTRYKRMIIKDVNNYLIEYYAKNDLDEEIILEKVKGVFQTKIELTKGYDNPIISEALYHYYKNKIPVEQTIKNCKDVYAFMRCEKTDTSKFNMVAKYRDGSTEVLQKTNRWVVTSKNSKECILLKKSIETNDTTNLQKGRYVTITNDVFKETTVESLKIDYEFYILECLKIINSIKINKSYQWVKQFTIQKQLEF